MMSDYHCKSVECFHEWEFVMDDLERCHCGAFKLPRDKMDDDRITDYIMKVTWEVPPITFTIGNKP